MNKKLISYPSWLSYWEIEQYLANIDLLIVGSGIVGLTSAIFFKKANPKAKVVVVERGFLPSGASTKNAGFACFGSLSEILADLKTSPEDEVFELIAKRVSGLYELRHLLGDESFGYSACGGYEIFRKEDKELLEKCLDFLPKANQTLHDSLGIRKTYTLKSEEIDELGFRNVSNLILNQHEGSIDTGKMMNALIRLASSLDIRILNSFEVSNWSDDAAGVNVSFENGLTVKPRKLHFATNGFGKQLMPELDVKPARAQVLITKEIPNLKVKGTFHMDEGFYYFSNVGNRILLGGGRNLDIAGETTSEFKTTQLIQCKLDELLDEVILPDTPFEIEHRWAGVMGVGTKKRAIVRQISDNVSCAVRLGGMGVAIGTLIGKESAEMLT